MQCTDEEAFVQSSQSSLPCRSSHHQLAAVLDRPARAAARPGHADRDRQSLLLYLLLGLGGARRGGGGHEARSGSVALMAPPAPERRAFMNSSLDEHRASLCCNSGDGSPAIYGCAKPLSFSCVNLRGGGDGHCGLSRFSSMQSGGWCISKTQGGNQ